MLRGDNVSRICAGCGTMVAEGIFTCTAAGCGGRTYDLFFDRNCGGTYLLVWYEYTGAYAFSAAAADLRSPDHTQIHLTQAHQRRNFNDRTRRDELLGLLTRVMDDGDDDFTHYLGLKGGTVLSRGVPVEGRNEDEWIKIKVTQHTNAEGQPHPSKLKSWEVSNGRIDPRQCMYCTQITREKCPPNSPTRKLEAMNFSCKASASAPVTDPNDSHHPHKGRKMMLFSDGRQRAAKWPSKSRRIRPLMRGARCLWPAASALVPRTSRERTSHQQYLRLFVSLLRPCASTHSATRRRCLSVRRCWAQCANICLFGSHLPHGRNRNHPPTLGGKKCVERRHLEDYLKHHIKKKMQSETYQNLRMLRERIEDEDQEDQAKVDALKKAMDKHVSSILSANEGGLKRCVLHYAEQIELPADFTAWGDDLGQKLPFFEEKTGIEWKWESLKQAFDNLSIIVEDELLTNAFATKRMILDDHKEGHLHLSEMLAKSLLQRLRDGDITPRHDKCDATLERKRSSFRHLCEPPRQFGALLLRWISHGFEHTRWDWAVSACS